MYLGETQAVSRRAAPSNETIADTKWRDCAEELGRVLIRMANPPRGLS
jgi:hypothetical protein